MKRLYTPEQQEAAIGELEALLYAASRPLRIATIALRLSLDEAEAAELVERYAAGLAAPGRGLQLRDTGSGWRLETKPEHAAVLAAERTLRKAKPLTPQALEALAVIALAQPVTTEEVSRTRGTESYAAIETLRRHGLVAPAAPRGPAEKAIRWRTTQRLLEQLGLTSVSQLAQLSSDALLNLNTQKAPGDDD